VRARGNQDLGAMPLAAFVEKVEQAIRTKA